MQTIYDWIEELKKCDKFILVEGKKDKKSLEYFKIRNIFTLNKPLYEVVEEISDKTKECILLLDLDKEGKKLYRRLKLNLQRHGVKVDTKFREFLFKKTKLSQIEGLKKYLEHEKT